MADTLRRTEFYYGKEHVLQNVAVWEFQDEIASENASKESKARYWLIFVHGGAWRDPRETFSECEPTIAKLLGPESPLPDPRSRIAGFASLNYRLSPHPSFAQDLESTPAFARRTAVHPDHLRDVSGGLAFLQRRFGFAGNYILYGHSAGAFLSFQVLLGGSLPGGDTAQRRGATVAAAALPAAVVGFEGIYDLCGLNERTGGAYAALFEPAFGTGRDSWAAVGPATAGGNYQTAWGAAGGRAAVLAHSPEDELVDMAELDTMEKRLRGDGVHTLVFRDLVGGHSDGLNGGQFARVLARTVEELDRLQSW